MRGSAVIVRVLLVLLTMVAGVSMPAVAVAQIAMPDAREMSGIPRPVTDLPERTVSVRLIRGSLSNNITDHPVELLVNGEAQTVSTDDQGRAQFGPLAAGATLKAVAVVDGERLESMEFPAPSQGGIRVMLVATDPEQASREAAARAAAVPGEVTLGGESRFVIEPDDEIVRVYYLLDIINGGTAPVQPREPFVFETPAQATSTTVMDGAPQAAVAGRRVSISGPFPPGNTFASIAFALPAPTGSVEIHQVFPATLDHLGLIVEKVGEPVVTSHQIERQQEMPVGDRMYIASAGGTIPAGTPVEISISGLPHHSQTPRWVAIGIAVLVGLGGAWFAWRPTPTTSGNERKKLLARREKLLQELVKLEAQHQRGKIDGPAYRSRREQLMASLEHIYGALDTDDTGPEPASRTGLAA
ncbi:MAG: hypothetical protein AB7F99_02260 [Vicinamibacterales bacterium]